MRQIEVFIKRTSFVISLMSISDIHIIVLL